MPPKRKTPKGKRHLELVHSVEEPEEWPSPPRQTLAAGRLATSDELDREIAQELSWQDVKELGGILKFSANTLLNQYRSVERKDINAEKLRRAFEFVAKFSDNVDIDSEALVKKHIRDLRVPDEHGHVPALELEAAALEDSLEMLDKAFDYISPNLDGAETDPTSIRELTREICPTDAWRKFAANIIAGVVAAHTILRFRALREGQESVRDVLAEMRLDLLEEGVKIKLEPTVTDGDAIEAYRKIVEHKHQEAWRKLLKRTGPWYGGGGRN